MRIAVMDIGSNAIRCAAYSGATLGSHELYSEKFAFDTRSLLRKYNPTSHQYFHTIIGRFLEILTRLSIQKVLCVATAALRDSPKSRDFCDTFARKYGININVLGGEQEAFLSSYGFLMGSVQAKGTIVDLGGGSLEMTGVQAFKLSNPVSMKLGTNILIKIENLSLEYIINQIQTHYAQHLKTGENLYLIGGGFRIIARDYIKNTRYPIANLHNLEIPTDQLLDHLIQIRSSTRQTFANIKRKASMSGLVLESLIAVLSPQMVVFSNYGVKEGVYFTNLPQEERYKNLLFERCKELVGFEQNKVDLDGYVRLISDAVLGNKDDYLDVISLALILKQHRNYLDRNSLGCFLCSFMVITDIPFSHWQRAMLGKIFSLAFSGQMIKSVKRLAEIKLTDQDHINASIIAELIKVIEILEGPWLLAKLSLPIKFENKLVLVQDNITLQPILQEAERSIIRINQLRTNPDIIES